MAVTPLNGRPTIVSDVPDTRSLIDLAPERGPLGGPRVVALTDGGRQCGGMRQIYQAVVINCVQKQLRSEFIAGRKRPNLRPPLPPRTQVTVPLLEIVTPVKEGGG